MKRLDLIVACIGAAAFFPMAASALTEQWRYTATGAVQQIAVDGKGGCAFVAKDSNDVSNIAWLDRKGRVLYTVAGLGSAAPLGVVIYSCTPKQLLFSGALGFPVMGQVNAKGIALPVAAFGGIVIGGPMFPIELNTQADKKGFFVVNSDTNTLVDSIVRYTYK